MVDADACLSTLWRGVALTERQVYHLCAEVKTILMEETNVVPVEAPVTVVGDIHGQFYDMLEMFRVSGCPPDHNFLFLGNFVDRGAFSVETLSLLLALKLKYSKRITLLRGSHESRAVSKAYGFYDECIDKYGSAGVWHSFTDLFDYLPLSALVDQKLFCVHGGPSPLIRTLDQLVVIDRFHDIPPQGQVTDLLWSDPDTGEPGGSTGHRFTRAVLQEFCQTNKLSRVARGHQLVHEGVCEMFEGQLVSLWSAPNFLGSSGRPISERDTLGSTSTEDELSEARRLQEQLHTILKNKTGPEMPWHDVQPILAAQYGLAQRGLEYRDSLRHDVAKTEHDTEKTKRSLLEQVIAKRGVGCKEESAQLAKLLGQARTHHRFGNLGAVMEVFDKFGETASYRYTTFSAAPSGERLDSAPFTQLGSKLGRLFV